MKCPINAFLAKNPISHPFTKGLFFREKMRAIHRVAPDSPFNDILEIGGGRGGLTSLLYPHSQVVNLDIDATYADAPCNRKPGVRFVCGDATDLPFPARSFDAVTLFDVLEHIPDDTKAIREVLRVLRPGGYVILSTPNENWKHPYYRWMRPFCPTEKTLFAQWGHVRRGYTRAHLEKLIGARALCLASFINPWTVISHDIGLTDFKRRWKLMFWAILSPITLAGYLAHSPHTRGTETAYSWRLNHVLSGNINKALHPTRARVEAPLHGGAIEPS